MGPGARGPCSLCGVERRAAFRWHGQQGAYLMIIASLVPRFIGLTGGACDLFFAPDRCTGAAARSRRISGGGSCSPPNETVLALYPGADTRISCEEPASGSTICKRPTSAC